MKIKKFLFSLICLFLGAIAFVPKGLSVAKADTLEYTVKFDYNMSAISEKFSSDIRSIKDYTFTVSGGEHALVALDSEDSEKFKVISSAYILSWTVDGIEKNIDEYRIYDNTTFVAKWTPREFLITFNCMGSSDYPVGQEIEPFRYTIDTLSGDYNVAYRFRPSRTSYSFGGWFKDSSFSDISQVFEIGISDLGSYTLYAKWIPNEYRINYNTTGENTKNPTSYNVEENSITLYEPTSEGHIFKGWYLDEKLTIPVSEIDCSWARDINVYPKWELEVYRVTYILPDGTRAQVECEYGKTVKLPTELKKSIFEVVKTDVSRDNIKCDTRITITLVNIWWVYLIALLVLIAVVFLIILIKRKRERNFNRMRKTYQSNSSKYSKYQRRSVSTKNNRKNW